MQGHPAPTIAGSPREHQIECSWERPMQSSTTNTISEVDCPPRQSSQSPIGGNLARRRYQKGSLFLRGKNPVWVGRWLEDVMDANGTITRQHRSEVIGTKAQ